MKDFNKLRKNTEINKLTIKLPEFKKSRKFYTNKKGTIKNIVSVLAGVAVGAGISVAVANKNDNNKESNNYIVANLVDDKEDEYKEQIPLETEEGICLIDQSATVFIKSTKGKDNQVIVLDEKNGIVAGSIDSKYLKKSLIQFSEDVLKDYDTIYSINAEKGANLRNTPDFSTSTNIAAYVAENEFVLGTPYYTLGKNNSFPWVSVIYVNESGIYQGYIREDLLEKSNINLSESFKQINEDIVEYKLNELDEKVIQSTSEQQTTETQDVTEVLPVIETQPATESQVNEIIEDDCIKMKVNTEKDGGIGLKLRSEPVRNANNIIDEIQNGTIITTTGKHILNGSREWAEVVYTNQDGNEVKSWVAKAYLEEVYDKIMIVDTAADGSIPLKLRESANIQSEILLKIENGREIKITNEQWESRDDSKYKWMKIKIDEIEGYVSSNYLKEKEMSNDLENNTPENSSNVQQEIMSKISLNAQGAVTGIDVSGMSANELRKIFENDIKIPNSVMKYNSNGTAYQQPTSKISGDINFVYIRIGRTGWGEQFSAAITENYLEQARVCEEYQIPYGFYYYSTSRDNSEAKNETDLIINAINSLPDNCKYNVLPFVIDSETVGNNDRQNGYDVSEAKAYMFCQLEPQIGKCILYTSGKAAINGNQKILDLESINNLLGKQIPIWYTAPNEFENEVLGNRNQSYIPEVIDNNHVVMRQALMDAYISGVSGAMDINIISKEDYEKLISSDKEIFNELCDPSHREIDDDYGIIP